MQFYRCFLILYISLINLLFLSLFIAELKYCNYDYVFAIVFFSIVTLVVPFVLILIASWITPADLANFAQKLKKYWLINGGIFLGFILFSILLSFMQTHTKCTLYFG
ncbi:hypothetical protein B9T26_06330 [Acinetobacter sp. ANC 4169]|nr:hypothetical protein B9T26_06330 [Acinetobacter sp. ANC 4169]